MDLTTLAQVKMLIPLDTTSSDTYLSYLITGMSDQVTRYLDRTFEKGIYNFTGYLDGSRDVILDITPITNILYAAQDLSCGCSGSAVIEVIYDGIAFPSIMVGDNSETIIFNSSTAETITIAETDTIQDLADSINALTDWTATVQNDNELLPARAITEVFKNTTMSSYEWKFSIVCPLNPFYLQIVGNKGLCKASTCLTHNFVVLYEAGYELTDDLPAGLQMLVAQMVADLYQGSTHDTSLKSEKVGDYSYALGDGAFSNMIFKYTRQLSSYRNISV